MFTGRSHSNNFKQPNFKPIGSQAAAGNNVSMLANHNSKFGGRAIKGRQTKDPMHVIEVY